MSQLSSKIFKFIHYGHKIYYDDIIMQIFDLFDLRSTTDQLNPPQENTSCLSK